MDFSLVRSSLIDYFLSNSVARIVDNFFPVYDPNKTLMRQLLEIAAQMLTSAYLFTSIRYSIIQDDISIFAASIIDQSKMKTKICHLYDDKLFPMITQFISTFKNKPVVVLEENKPQSNIPQDDNNFVYTRASTIPDDNF